MLKTRLKSFSCLVDKIIGSSEGKKTVFNIGCEKSEHGKKMVTIECTCPNCGEEIEIEYETEEDLSEKHPNTKLNTHNLGTLEENTDEDGNINP